MDELFAIKHSYLIPLLPLLGACISGFFGARWLKGNSHWPIWIGVGCSAILSFALLFGMLGHMPGHHDGADAAHGGAEHSAAPDSAETTETSTLGINKTFFTWITAGNPDNKPHDNERLAISRWAGIEEIHPQAGERDEHASGNEDAAGDAVPAPPPATE